MQNGDILIPAGQGLPGKMAVEMEREYLVVWSVVGVSDHTLYVLITCEIWFCRRFSREWLIDQSPSALVPSRLKHSNGEIFII